MHLFVSIRHFQLCTRIVRPYDIFAIEFSVRFRSTNELSKYTYVFGDRIGADSSQLAVVTNYKCPKDNGIKTKKKSKEQQKIGPKISTKNGSVRDTQHFEANRAGRLALWQFATVGTISRTVPMLFSKRSDR